VQWGVPKALPSNRHLNPSVRHGITNPRFAAPIWWSRRQLWSSRSLQQRASASYPTSIASHHEHPATTFRLTSTFEGDEDFSIHDGQIMSQPCSPAGRRASQPFWHACPTLASSLPHLGEVWRVLPAACRDDPTLAVGKRFESLPTGKKTVRTEAANRPPGRVPVEACLSACRWGARGPSAGLSSASKSSWSRVFCLAGAGSPTACFSGRAVRPVVAAHHEFFWPPTGRTRAA